LALVPLLLGLARDRRRRRVLDFDPAVGAAGPVRRTQTLRHDALTAERAGILVDDRAIAGVVLVEDNSVRRPPQQLIGKLRCSLFSTVEMLAIRLEFLVGAPRFELGTPSPPDWCANRAALRSDLRNIINVLGICDN
jgi:hypothetical protein